MIVLIIVIAAALWLTQQWGEEYSQRSLHAAQAPMTWGKAFRDRLKAGGEGPEMLEIQPRKFRMGDIQGVGRQDEQPVHEVRSQKPFAIGRYEVTFEEYARFAEATKRHLPDDQGWGGGKRPVINVSWQDARDYAKWLSEQTGKRYRLPTEAEWEYAARSGGEEEKWAGTSNENELGEYAWYHRKYTRYTGNSGLQTHPVGEKKPNGLGLYDMSGNVSEWAEDCWHGNYNNAPTDGRAWEQEDGGRCDLRVIRGGSWYNGPGDVRSSHRDRVTAGHGIGFLGFRLVQDLD